MQKAVHAMRLRSRNSSNDNAGSTVDSTAATSVSQPSGRAVLGDVSNKRGAPSDATRTAGQKASKRPRRTLDNSKATHSANDENVSANARNRDNVSRRVSARLREKTVGRSSKRSRASARTVGRDDVESAESAESDSDVEICEDERKTNEVATLDDIVLPLRDYQLQRRDFDGTNHTLGCSPYDQIHRSDVLQVANYVTDLFQHLYRAESESAPSPYMEDQRDINAKMRAILVDWLVEVHMKFRLVPETLYLCVNLIDRYCNQVAVARSKLQLVGVTALLIACKYEEIYPPEVRDCVYITDRAYQRQEVLDMEQDILQCLQFKITVPTAYPFLVRFLHITNASTLTKYAAHYYMERTLQEHDLLEFRPSLVCAASVALAINNPDIHRQENSNGVVVEKLPGLPPSLLEYTNFEPNEIVRCAEVISKKVAEEPVTASRRQLIAVKRKYDNRKYLHVSSAVEQPSHLDIISGTESVDDSCSTRNP